VVAGILAALIAGRAAAQCDQAPIRDPAREFEARIKTWNDLREENVVMQRHEYTCGAAAMATVLRYYWGDQVTENDVLAKLLKVLTPAEMQDRVKNGLSITDLRRAAEKLGYQASIGTLSFNRLTESRIPLVVPLKLKEFKHFVVYRGVADGRVYLADPVRGNVRPTVHEFLSEWQQHAVLAIAKPDVEPPPTSPISMHPEDTSLGTMTKQTINHQLPLPALLPTFLPDIAPP
jgi:predicted double-glycine peptidase